MQNIIRITEKGVDDEEALTKKTLVQDIDKYLNNKLITGIDKTCICTRKGLLGKLSSLFKEYNIDIKPCNERKQVNGKRKSRVLGYKIEIDQHFKNLAMGLKSPINLQ